MELKRLASNATYLTIDWLIASVLSLLFWVVSGKLLASEQLGVVSTSYNLASVIAVVTTLGISNALYKLISEYIGNNKSNSVSSLLKSSFKTLLISNSIALAILILFSKSLAPILKLSPEVVIITGVISVFLSFSNALGFAQLGFQKMKSYMITNAVSHSIRLLSAAGLIILGFTFFGT